MDLTSANKKIIDFQQLITEKKKKDYKGNLKVGIDLGTANIVVAVLDENNQAVAGASQSASVVRDGLVVDYVEAVRIVQNLKQQVETILGEEIIKAATALPPGTLGGNSKAMVNVIESAEVEVINVIDEPTAAASILGIQDGAVVDVGGGTTGISILKNGEVTYTADEATGGTHMSLVLAGNYKITFEEAEILKKDVTRHREVFVVIKPVIEKMASIVKRHIEGHGVEKVYLVGGASCIKGFEDVFEKELGIEVYKPKNPLLVTPLGIALNCQG
ncbi:MAG: ethanolamine utilization protein EutJ [Clostridiales bacterium]|nr:ethanolamine utilization protein EutJ [Clostridiales bacterium]